MEGHNLQVAVRVKPVSGEELNNAFQGGVPNLTLSVNGAVLTIAEPTAAALAGNVQHQSTPQSTPLTSGQGATHSFSFDTVLWSAQCHPRLTPNRTQPQTQADVYRHVGPRLLKNVLDGFNSCLFAYGQTGSGKTYSMIGDIERASVDRDPEADDERGVIPRLAAALFAAIKESPANSSARSAQQQTLCYRAELTFVEIYCERVRDLLSRTQTTLRVRQSPISGPYIEDLSVHRVESAAEVMELIRVGMKERATAETKMNQRSSRSHAIVQLQLTAMWEETSTGKTTQRSSKVSLVDLAGSERVNQSGAVGERFEEAKNINLSLTTLGRVIQCLVDSQAQPAIGVAANGEKANPGSTGSSIIVPYRDSQLTWLLSDSLGGNSKTMMLATVSPAPYCYQQSLNTLRFAGVAQKIVNVVHVNEERDSLVQIAALREQVERLTLQLGQANGSALTHRIASLTEQLEQSQEQRRALEVKLKSTVMQKEAEDAKDQRRLQVLVTQQATEITKIRNEKVAETANLKSELSRKNLEIQELQETLKKRETEYNALLQKSRTGLSVAKGGASVKKPDEAQGQSDSEKLRQLREQTEVRVSLLTKQLSDAKDETARAVAKYQRESEKRVAADAAALKAQSESSEREKSFQSQIESLRNELESSQRLCSELRAAEVARIAAAQTAAAKEESKETITVQKQSYDEQCSKMSKLSQEVEEAQEQLRKVRKHNVKMQMDLLQTTKQKDSAVAESTKLKTDVAELEVLLLEETESTERGYLQTTLLEQLRETLLIQLQFAFIIASDDTAILTSQLAMQDLVFQETRERQELETEVATGLGRILASSAQQVAERLIACTSQLDRATARSDRLLEQVEAGQRQLQREKDVRDVLEGEIQSLRSENRKLFEQAQEMQTALEVESERRQETERLYSDQVADIEELEGRLAAEALHREVEADAMAVQHQEELDSLSAKLAEVDAEKETLTQERNDALGTNARLEAELSKLQLQLQQLQLEASTAVKSSDTLRMELEHELKLQQEKADQQEVQIQQLHITASEHVSRIDFLEKELKISCDTVKTLRSEVDEERTVLTNKIVGLENKTESLMAQLELSQRTNATLEQALASANRNLAEAERREDETKTKYTALLEDRNRLETLVTELKANLAQAHHEKLSVATALSAAEANLNEKQSKLNQLTMKVENDTVNLQMQLQTALTEKEALQVALAELSNQSEEQQRMLLQRLEAKRAETLALAETHRRTIDELVQEKQLELEVIQRERDSAKESLQEMEHKCAQLERRVVEEQQVARENVAALEKRLEVAVEALEEERMKGHRLQSRVTEKEEELQEFAEQLGWLQLQLMHPGEQNTNPTGTASPAVPLAELGINLAGYPLTPQRCQSASGPLPISAQGPPLGMSDSPVPNPRLSSRTIAEPRTPSQQRRLTPAMEAELGVSGSAGRTQRAIEAKEMIEQQLDSFRRFNELIRLHSMTHGEQFKRLEDQLKNVDGTLRHGQQVPLTEDPTTEK